MALEPTQDQIVKLAAGITKGTCQYLHKGNHLTHWLENFFYGAKFGLKFYFPLHFIPLLFRYKQILNKPLESIKSALKGCVRSTMVLAVMVLIGKMSVCMCVCATNNMSSYIMTITSALVTLAAFIETPARISEMALYVLPRFFDAFWKFLKRRGLSIEVPYTHVILFSTSLAAIMYSFKCEKDNIKPMYRKFCEGFFGEN